MLFHLSTGAVLGLSAGLSPGPLLALVISHSVRHGAREGIRVAAAPLLTDLPIILLSTFVLSRLSGYGALLGAVSLAGSAYLVHMALDSWGAPPPGAAAGYDRPDSLLRGAAVNALSPHPWLFWLTVGGPAILDGRASGPAAPLLFVAGFTACLVGSKCVVAILAARSAGRLTGRGYERVMQTLGFLLLLFAAYLFIDGLRLLGLLR